MPNYKSYSERFLVSKDEPIVSIPENVIERKAEQIYRDIVSRRIVYLLMPKKDLSISDIKKTLAISIFYFSLSYIERNYGKDKMQDIFKEKEDKLYHLSTIFNIRKIQYGDFASFLEKIKTPYYSMEEENFYFESVKSSVMSLLYRISESSEFINRNMFHEIKVSSLLKPYFNF